MYNTQILNKYNFVFTNYDTNEAITKQSVPNEYRLINTIVSYLDFKGFLHIELFVGTEEDITDDKWIDETNWVSTKLIYHKCFNEKYDTDFATTAIKVPCPVRFRGNVLHIQDVPQYDTCGEVYYEDKTYRYKCICCDDCKYGNIDNWEEYDFQIILDDIVKIVTDLMQEANDINYGLLTPDEEMINNLVEDLFLKWLTDERLQDAVDSWLSNQNIDTIIKDYLDGSSFQKDVQEALNQYLRDYDFQTEVTNAVNQYLINYNDQIDSIVSEWLNDQDFTQQITNAVNEALQDVDYESTITEIVQQYIEEGNLNTLLQQYVTNYLDSEGFAKTKILTQTEYNQLQDKDSQTIYFIRG